MVCLQCAGELVIAETKRARGETVPLPVPEEAWTMAPTWQQQVTLGQLVMACVAVPVCKKHLDVAEISPADQAVRNGRLLPGAVGS